ncbi:hypothetical protein EXIGLDRAFT_700763 [Exidia glandulosa HHB12029]|uniref:Uncharacterized protein n=1 Tax=Exidia glandulosa HHB12029 TaxID=1314781 RepID=A0A165LYT4_EXIGL|nr:hypothetical protein EXIGLDRAFT_700763 [Exidia glandulosa HHB12029]
MTVTVPHGGAWKTYGQLNGGFQAASAAKPHCYKCWFPLRGLHREDIKRDSQCTLSNILQPLLFLFWVNHSALIKSGFFGARQPQTFDEYWGELRAPEDGVNGYPVFVRYVIVIVQFLGVTQLPLPPSPGM